MSRRIDPRGLRAGDVVSPLFNPHIRVVVDRVGLSTLGAALSKHNPDVPGDIPVRLVFGTRYKTGEPARLLIGVDDQVRLVLRDGKRVGS
ncbi:hypothetical protein [Frankia sp. Cppng1_Ct_nod]|uniref:hypothetical protein n=1 Tax=Frankia sp. Cppng1_Ct_nod TaxID=2897162 RepID=UPI001040EB5F|nr:hypothetical protein [Frankia sp. Cppng1_Ct_nod]